MARILRQSGRRQRRKKPRPPARTLAAEKLNWPAFGLRQVDDKDLQHRLNPPHRSTYSSDVEAVHGLMEEEFYWVYPGLYALPPVLLSSLSAQDLPSPRQIPGHGLPGCVNRWLSSSPDPRAKIACALRVRTPAKLPRAPPARRPPAQRSGS